MWQIVNANKGRRVCKHQNKKPSVWTSTRGDVNIRRADVGITMSALCRLPSVSGGIKVQSAMLQPPVEYLRCSAGDIVIKSLSSRGGFQQTFFSLLRAELQECQKSVVENLQHCEPEAQPYQKDKKKPCDWTRKTQVHKVASKLNHPSGQVKASEDRKVRFRCLGFKEVPCGQFKDPQQKFHWNYSCKKWVSKQPFVFLLERRFGVGAVGIQLGALMFRNQLFSLPE